MCTYRRQVKEIQVNLGYLTWTKAIFSTIRRLSDIFRKGKRHFRRNFRNRTDDQEANPGPSQASPPATRSTIGGKSPFAGISSTDGLSVAVLKRADSTGSSDGAVGDSSKGRIQDWIHQQVSGFLQKWERSAELNPALSVVKKLLDASQELEPGSTSCLSAVKVSGIN